MLGREHRVVRAAARSGGGSPTIKAKGPSRKTLPVVAGNAHPATESYPLNLPIDTLPAFAYNVDIVAEMLGAFEQAVLLAVWKLADDAYGRGVLRGVQSALDREVAAGAVYATLDRLEQKNLIASRLEEGTPVRGGRVRRYYRVTAAGVKALNESKAALEQMWRGARWPLESNA